MNTNFSLRETVIWDLLLKCMKMTLIICSVVSTGCILLAMIMRYIFQSNFYGSDEIILLFAFWLYFMGAAHGSYEDSHIKADLLNMYIKNMSMKDALNLVAQALTVAVNCILLLWSFDSLRWILKKMPLTTALKIPRVVNTKSDQ